MGDGIVARVSRHGIAGLLLALVASVAWGQPIVDPNTGHAYAILDAAGTWAQGKAAAEGTVVNGLTCHLLTINSQAEQDFIENNLLPLPNDESGWIGGRQPPNQATPSANWGWVTGEPFAFTNWNTGEPNDLVSTDGVEDNEENCLELYSSGVWNDAACGNSINVLIECETLPATAAPTMSLTALSLIATLLLALGTARLRRRQPLR
jgi:hypothetical protein